MFFLSKVHQSASFVIIAVIPAITVTTEAIAIAEEIVIDGREATTAITTAVALVSLLKSVNQLPIRLSSS